MGAILTFLIFFGKSESIFISVSGTIRPKNGLAYLMKNSLPSSVSIK